VADVDVDERLRVVVIPRLVLALRVLVVLLVGVLPEVRPVREAAAPFEGVDQLAPAVGAVGVEGMRLGEEIVRKKAGGLLVARDQDAAERIRRSGFDY
jgi:hypothetical protein